MTTDISALKKIPLTLRYEFYKKKNIDISHNPTCKIAGRVVYFYKNAKKEKLCLFTLSYIK